MGESARDLLRRFSGDYSEDEVAGGDSDEIELGLSLGGCFSSQDAGNNKLVRSSSIPTVLTSEFPQAIPLLRACSMPSETEEEIRRRKEMQSFKRMEAKRKREEKRNLKICNEDFGGGSVVKMRKWLRRFGVLSQGSVVSQGSSSSGGSEFESRPGQVFEAPGIICSSDIRSPSKASIMAEQKATSELPSSKNMMEEMPSVSTRGEGPNGKRIEGFLYKYRKGEDVRIVCVCHGSFLTPAEFVKHAGGGDVAHPLRHILVNPSSASFL